MVLPESSEASLVSQPICARCSAPLPWEDVDRGSGTCRHCGHAFAFGAIPIVPVGTGAPLAPATELALPSVRVAQPSSVTVSTGTDGFSVSLRRSGVDIRTVGTTAVAVVMVFIFLRLRDWLTTAVFFVLASVLGYATLRGLGGTQSTVIVGPSSLRSPAQPEPVPLAYVTRFVCEATVVTKRRIQFGVIANEEQRPSHDVSALLHDGRVVSVLTGVDDRATAIFLAQILQERLGH